jgi:putative alpha-1,2-mannosidase
VWNALGFYPAVPGVGGVVFGTPMFDKTTMQLAGGRTLVVSRQGEGIYVQSASIDSAPYANSWLPISNLHPGTTTLRFTMAPCPINSAAVQSRIWRRHSDNSAVNTRRIERMQKPSAILQRIILGWSTIMKTGCF